MTMRDANLFAAGAAAFGAVVSASNGALAYTIFGAVLCALGLAVAYGRKWP